MNKKIYISNGFWLIKLSIFIISSIMILLLGMFSISCKKKSTFNLKIEKMGTGSIVALWKGGSATDEQLSIGVNIPKNREVRLVATTDSTSIEWVYGSTNNFGNVLLMTLNANTNLRVKFYNLIRLAIKKTGTGSISAKWPGGSATDEELAAGINVQKDMQISFTATTDSTDVDWTYNAANTSGNNIIASFPINTIMDVIFYNTAILIVNKTGTGSVTAQWGTVGAYDNALKLGVKIPVGSLVKLVAKTDSTYTKWIYNSQATLGDTLIFNILNNTNMETIFYN